VEAAGWQQRERESHRAQLRLAAACAETPRSSSLERIAALRCQGEVVVTVRGGQGCRPALHRRACHSSPAAAGGAAAPAVGGHAVHVGPRQCELVVGGKSDISTPIIYDRQLTMLTFAKPCAEPSCQPGRLSLGRVVAEPARAAGLDLGAMLSTCTQHPARRRLRRCWSCAVCQRGLSARSASHTPTPLR
jgi:hypothetical protein